MILELGEGKSNDLAVQEILILHSVILCRIDQENSGSYQTIQVRISGSDVVLPDPLQIPDLMKEVIDWLGRASHDLYPVQLATEAHYRLVSIHPFSDGNGRMARLLMNLILLQNGDPPLIRPDDPLAGSGPLNKRNYLIKLCF